MTDKDQWKPWRPDQPDSCPFCGGMPQIMTQSLQKYVMCEDCHATSKLCDTHEKAVEAWNKRNDWSYALADALNAAHERESKLNGILATVAALFDEETGTVQLGRPLHEALVAAKAALSQPSQAPAQGEPAEMPYSKGPPIRVVDIDHVAYGESGEAYLVSKDDAPKEQP